jgi:hypothetical protein
VVPHAYLDAAKGPRCHGASFPLAIASKRQAREMCARRERGAMVLEHAPWFLGAWVFCNQVGIPVPVIPALIGAGALAGSGHLSMALISGSAIGASLMADVLWYGLGR